MKKLTIDQWEKKYIVGPIERFDPKYGMFRRVSWDAELRGRLKDWGFTGEIKPKPGYTMQDHALQRASATFMFNRFESSRNPSPAPGVPAGAMAASDSVMPMINNPPQVVKIDASDPLAMTRDIKKVATYFGASLVGICKLDRRWVYLDEEIPEEFQYAVVMAFEEEYELIKYHPTPISSAAATMGYSHMAVTNAYLSAFIKNLGYQAVDSQNDIALSIPMAIQAGLGDLGRLGFLITPEFGPRVRLSKIITDLPLVADSPIDFGVTKFCTVCKKCAYLCPSQSISYGERTTEPNNVSNNGGVLKWPINAETCRMHWSRIKSGCTTCIACCPYNKPNTWPHRATLWFTDHIRWADALYVKMDDLFGYGKPQKTDKFWEEWQP